MKLLNSATWDSLRFQPLWLRRVNEDLRAAVLEGSSNPENSDDDSAKLAVREGRRQALTSFRHLNDRLVADIEDNKGTGEVALGALKNLTRDRVMSVLDGRPLPGTPNAQRGLNTDFGISPNYLRFIQDVRDQSQEAEYTIGDVDFALSHLNYVSNAFSNRLEREKNNYHNYNRWWSLFDMSREEAQGIFDTRSTVVTQVFTDLQTQLTERKASKEAEIKTHAERVEEEFEMMAPDEKAQFLEETQAEVDEARRVRGTNQLPSDQLNANHRAGVMEGLSFFQRLEIYEAADLNQEKVDRNLQTASDDEDYIKTEYATSRSAVENSVQNLDLGRIRTNLRLHDGNVEAADLIGDPDFLNELESHLNEHGARDRNNQFFAPFSDHFGLSPHETFIALCGLMQNNPNGICDRISPEFKKKILACLKWIEEKESVANEDIQGFSPEFITFDNHVFNDLDSFESLITRAGGIKRIKHLGEVQLSDIQGIDQLVNQASTHLSQYQAVKEKNKLSDSETTFLEKKFEKLQIVLDQLKKIREKINSSEAEYASIERDYNRAEQVRLNRETKRNNIGGATRPAEDVQTQTTPTPNGPITQHVVVNQTLLNAWDAANDKLTEAEEALSEVRAKSGTSGANPISKNDFDLNIIDAELNSALSEIGAELQIIREDRRPVAQGGRGRQQRNNINQPNDLFKSYLQRQALDEQTGKLDEKLEAARQRSLDYLKQKKVGSKININCLPYQHGNPPTSDEAIQVPNNRRVPLTDCIILMNPEGGTGTVLFHPGTSSIIVVQIGKETGRTEIISKPAPANSNISQDGLTSGFDIGEAENFTATPTEILAA